LAAGYVDEAAKPVGFGTTKVLAGWLNESFDGWRTIFRFPTDRGRSHGPISWRQISRSYERSRDGG
jgi:hypothetical protein